LIVTALGGLRPETGFLHGLESLLIHESADAILSALDLLAPKHLLDAPAAVSTAALQKDDRDLLG
jgi:hypothetical protein